jgi:CRP-like cAMP-binding protein
MDRDEILELARLSPAIELSDGERLISEGSPDAALYVLAAGALTVVTGGRAIARLVESGSIVGEISLLLGTPASADVIADGDTIVHRIADAGTLFEHHPGFGRHLAIVLARRLRHATSFLGDVERQFADRGGTLGLVPRVLSGLLGGSGVDVDAGSEREPDSPY